MRPGFEDTATGVADDYTSASYKHFLRLKHENVNVRHLYWNRHGPQRPEADGVRRTFDYTARLYIGCHGCVRQIYPSQANILEG